LLDPLAPLQHRSSLHGRKAVDNQPQRLSRGVRIDGPDDHAVVGYINAGSGFGVRGSRSGSGFFVLRLVRCSGSRYEVLVPHSNREPRTKPRIRELRTRPRTPNSRTPNGFLVYATPVILN